MALLSMDKHACMHALILSALANGHVRRLHVLLSMCTLFVHAGLADPNALSQAVAAFHGCQLLGMPECEV